jgi:hypothetical protein
VYCVRCYRDKNKNKKNMEGCPPRVFLLVGEALIKYSTTRTHGSWAPVAHTCNPSYSGGRDQEDRGSKPAPANGFLDPISKIPNTKRAGGVVQVGPVFKQIYGRYFNAHFAAKKTLYEGK